jgi:hypothetical protein
MSCAPVAHHEISDPLSISMPCIENLGLWPNCQNLEEKNFTQMSITSSKMKIFKLGKNKNSNSNIFPQIAFNRFWILAFKNFKDSMEKSHFFQKKKRAKNPDF